MELYECVILNKNNQVVKRVAVDDRMDALKLEVAYNAQDKNKELLAEARLNGVIVE